jgi:hypothetical protein
MHYQLKEESRNYTEVTDGSNGSLTWNAADSNDDVPTNNS